ncbi:MAG: hypothetical protein J6I68_00120 [Butyrivibrio sp.]|uniref:hypothetical protein n=1 Tax=Butyrivibrio sp. TaxID=28121 RepID=UPI001B7484DF|nr:hypothetical protein [Butyrivibrio sp.]MBP3781633.1 hypothetical protein [Butyrivibrio sp.]
MDFKTFGFRNAYGVDLGETVRLYNEDPADYEASMCYVNSFHLCANMMRRGRGKFVRSVFGYVLSSDGERKVAVRHAWNMIEVGLFKAAVDVTMMANGESLFSVMGYTCLPVDEYTPGEFLEKVDKNNAMADLPVTQKEKKVVEKLKNKGFEVLGAD